MCFIVTFCKTGVSKTLLKTPLWIIHSLWDVSLLVSFSILFEKEKERPSLLNEKVLWSRLCCTVVSMGDKTSWRNLQYTHRYELLEAFGYRACSYKISCSSSIERKVAFSTSIFLPMQVQRYLSLNNLDRSIPSQEKYESNRSQWLDVKYTWSNKVPCLPFNSACIPR